MFGTAVWVLMIIPEGELDKTAQIPIFVWLKED